MIWWGFHLWQTVKLFLLSIQIYINCNIYSLDFLFHDTGVFESAVKRRLKRIMYYPLPHSQDFLEWGKGEEDFAVFPRHIWCPLIFSGCDLLMFLGVNLENEIFLNIYIPNLPWSPFLSQWSVNSFAKFFWCFYFNSHRVPHFSNCVKVSNILDNSPSAGAEFSPTPIFSKNKQKQNNIIS